MRAYEHRVRGGKHTRRVCNTEQVRNNSSLLIFLILLPMAIMVWSYWSVIVNLFNSWQSNDDYSAGQLVPIIALFLLWRERRQLKDCPFVPCWAGGAALLVLAEAASIYQFLAGAHPSIERYLMILAFLGLILMVAGWQVFRKIMWILLFLFLMVPLPGRVHNLISGPLQTMATTGSVFLMEAFGISVSQQGNVILLNETIPMGVEEACGGLRMLIAFVIAAAFMAYMVKCSRPKKAIILFSSIPVAVMCNILRLCVTGVLFMVAGTKTAERFFHDFAGLAMMPVAVLLLYAELWLLDKLIVPEPNLHHNKKAERAQSKSSLKAVVNERGGEGKLQRIR